MTEEEQHQQAIEDMEKARECLSLGQFWVKCPALPPDHPNHMVLEIRGLVDNQVVYRFWMKSKGYFGYGMDSLYTVAMNTGLAKGYSDKPLWSLAQDQSWVAYGVNPDDDDLVG